MQKLPMQLSSSPPVTSAVPSESDIKLSHASSSVSLPVAAKEPLEGSYSSTTFERNPSASPPANSTWPFVSSVAPSWKQYFIAPVRLNAPEAGSNSIGG